MCSPRCILALYFLVWSYAAIAQPSLEDTRSLSVTAHSMASDGYGLHSVSVDGNGYVNHHLLDNNGVIISGYSSTIAAGQYPVVTSFGGKLRVALKTGQQSTTLYQSSNGGASWSAIPNMPTITSDVFDLDSYTDDYGTHIVWSTGTFGDVEVWHMSFRDNTSEWSTPFNVTNLASPEYGYRPKVTASETKANVLFLWSGQLHSRDLTLSTNQWDNSYATVPNTNAALAVNAVTLGDSVYALFALMPTVQESHQYQDFFFTQRHKNTTTWLNPTYVSTTTYGLAYSYLRNRMVTAGDAVYFLINCNYNFLIPPPEQMCYIPVLYLWRYSSASGLGPEALFVGETNLEATDGSSLLLSKWNNGVYAFWSGDPNGYNMRRKPFALNGTVSERTLLTGNNWVSYVSGIADGATFDTSVAVDAMPGSETFVLASGTASPTKLIALGTLNAQQNSRFTCGENTKIEVYGQLNALGTSSEPVVFDAANPAQKWDRLAVSTGLAVSTISYCTILNANIGVDCAYSRLIMSNATISECLTGLSVINPHPKYYCIVSQSTISSCEYYGASVFDSYGVLLDGNLIADNDWGAMISGGTALLTKNAFAGNNVGFAASYGSYPRLGEMALDSPGENSFDNATIEIAAFLTSAPFMGLASQYGDMGGYNCVISDAPVFVDAYDESYVLAQRNSWNADPPDDWRFRVWDHAVIDYDKHLPECSFLEAKPVAGQPSLPSLMRVTPENRMLSEGMIHLGRRRFGDAIQTLRSLVADYSTSAEARAALVHLAHAYRAYAAERGNDSSLQVMRLYLRNQVLHNENSSMRRIARILHAGELSKAGDFTGAQQQYSTLINESRSSNERLHHVFAAFMLQAIAMESKSSALPYLTRLRAEWPNEHLSKLAQLHFDGISPISRRTHLEKNGATHNPQAVPQSYALFQNYPNPFNPSTTVRFQTPHDGFVSVKVYNMLGQEVATLVNEQRVAGVHEVIFDASRFSSGVYIYKLTAGGFTAAKKLVLVK
ncbi:MAG: T9SS type A sorting domain-containing protein [Bacteroidetes bacterium]|nr:T9SS type A sorting domain-containing protein [Bacteroidota bacterium]MCW5895656.1 T9SS type A sorting domain-containing protein [Bacteroidota bacterium]